MKNISLKLRGGKIDNTFSLIPTLMIIWNDVNSFTNRRLISIDIRWMCCAVGVLFSRTLKKD